MPKAKNPAPKPMSKSAIVQAIADMLGETVSRKQIKATLDALEQVGHEELKKTGVFLLPGFAKFFVAMKPARPAKQGINPFTKQPMDIEAKPASKTIRARPLKGVKQMFDE
ncbi:MAG: HU family DNA-binding protein [Polyangiaceae bacterium]|nr:HU family DNA-binding protein [Polyangiaceae bacterium]